MRDALSKGSESPVAKARHRFKRDRSECNRKRGKREGEKGIKMEG
jgi:hypothetical protein